MLQCMVVFVSRRRLIFPLQASTNVSSRLTLYCEMFLFNRIKVILSRYLKMGISVGGMLLFLAKKCVFHGHALVQFAFA